MRHCVIFALLAAAPPSLSGCVSTPPLHAADSAAPAFPVARFFSGRTQGEGMLTVLLSGPRAIRVSSLGRSEADGAIALDQTISEQGRPVRTRSWRLREVAPGRYEGTLSDAAGPVIGEARGNRLHLRFPMRGGLHAEQWLSLAPDGRSARNVLRVRKLGVTVAALDETIRKLD